MNRYTKLTYGTLNDLPLPELPFEAMGNLLAGYQKQKDFFDTQADSDFSTLDNESDKELGDQVRKYREDISSKLTDIYMKGDTKQYMSALRGGVKNLIDLRSAGGAITALESRVKQVSQIKKDLEEQYKDDVDKTNYKYALSQIRLGDVGYDPDARTFNSISKPIYQNFFDVQKRIDEAIKLISASETGDIEIRDGYVWKNGKKTFNVREVVDSVMREPEVVEQMRIEAEYAMMNMTDEQKQSYIEMQEQKNNDIKDVSTDNISYLNGLLTSENKTERERGQSILTQFGYDTGGIDGNIGAKTNEAFKQYTEYQEQFAASKIVPANKDNIMQMILSEKKESYYRYFRNMRPDSETTDVRMMDWKEHLRRSTANMQNMITQLLNTPPSDTVVVPNPVTSSQVLDNLGEAKDNLETATEAVTSVLVNANSTEDGQVFNGDEIKDLSKIASKVVFIQQNKGNQDLESLYAKQYNLTPAIAAKQISALEDNHSLVENLQAVAETSTLVGKFEDISMNRAKQYSQEADIEDLQSTALNILDLEEPTGVSKWFLSSPKIETESGVITYNKNTNNYYIDINGKQTALNVSQSDVQKLTQAKTKEEFQQVLADNSDLARLYSIVAKDKMDEKLGKEIKSQEMTSYTLASQDLSKDPFLKQYAQVLVDNKIDGLIDPSTNGPAKWKPVAGGKPLKTNPGNLKLISFASGNIFGRPSQVVTAEDSDGNKYELTTIVDPANIGSFNNSLRRHVIANLNAGNEEQAGILLRSMNAQNPLKLYNMANTKPDVGKKIVLPAIPGEERTIAYNYEVLDSKSFSNKEGGISNYETIVFTNPYSQDDKSNYRYAVIDKSSNELYGDVYYRSFRDAQHELDKLELLIGTPTVTNAATEKKQSFTAQQAGQINLEFPSGFGKVLPALMSGFQDEPIQLLTAQD